MMISKRLQIKRGSADSSEWGVIASTDMAKPGLYENIRKRRAAGKKPRKPGTKGAPTAQDFKNAAKTAKKPKPKRKR